MLWQHTSACGCSRVTSELSDLEGAEPGELGAQPGLFLMLYAWWISFYTCTLLGLGHDVGRYVRVILWAGRQ